MKEFGSNEEFFGALKVVIDRWCDERNIRALARILPSYIAFNGLGDGWRLLSDSLKDTRALGHEAFSHADWESLNDLIHAADLAAASRR
jgi:hypothetical protein